MAVQADLGISRLMLAANGQTAGLRSGDGGQMARLANSYASQKLGLAPGREPGGYLPVYEMRTRTIEEPVYETRNLTRSEEVFEERTVTETRDVIETRPVYEDRAILETTVTGERRLTGYDSISEAGIDRGADFAVTVADGETAVITFQSSSAISVTIDGETAEFRFSSRNGGWRAGLRDALNSIDGLSARFSSNGMLVLETKGGQSLEIEDVENGRWDWSHSPLSRLGLDAGVTEAEVVSQETVQTGTEEVIVGQEVVTVGTVLVQTGERSVVTGAETVMVGTISRTEGHDSKLVGLVEPETYGAGVLGLLAGEKSGPPDGFVELLFGIVEADQERGNNRGFEPDVRAAYEEASGRTDPVEQEETHPTNAVADTGTDAGDDAARSAI